MMNVEPSFWLPCKASPPFLPYHRHLPLLQYRLTHDSCHVLCPSPPSLTRHCLSQLPIRPAHQSYTLVARRFTGELLWPNTSIPAFHIISPSSLPRISQALSSTIYFLLINPLIHLLLHYFYLTVSSNVGIDWLVRGGLVGWWVLKPPKFSHPFHF